jgi:hypothetical protein
VIDLMAPCGLFIMKKYRRDENCVIEGSVTRGSEALGHSVTEHSGLRQLDENNGLAFDFIDNN